MEQKIKSLDLHKTIGSVKLSGGDKLDVPKLSMLKLIKIVKFLGIDGAKLYNQSRDIFLDDSYEEIEKLAIVLENLEEEKIMHIFSILLDLDDEQVLALDLNEMLDVLLVYVEKTNISKTFSQVRELYKKMFKKELPDFKTLLDQAFPVIEEQTDQPEAQPKETVTPGKNS